MSVAFVQLPNVSTTCAAARHKPNFIAQSKPRHSVPRQVRAVLHWLLQETN